MFNDNETNHFELMPMLVPMTNPIKISTVISSMIRIVSFLKNSKCDY